MSFLKTNQPKNLSSDKAGSDPIIDNPKTDFEGYLNTLEKNWANPDPGDEEHVTAYRYTGKAVKPSLGASSYDGFTSQANPSKSALPKKSDAKKQNKWELGPNRPSERYGYFR